MSVLDREQLEALRRQIEEDYNLDLAAIERLQRRLFGSVGSGSGRSESSSERRVTVLPSMDSQDDPQPDELTNTLRGMFNAHRK